MPRLTSRTRIGPARSGASAIHGWLHVRPLTAIHGLHCRRPLARRRRPGARWRPLQPARARPNELFGPSRSATSTRSSPVAPAARRPWTAERLACAPWMALRLARRCDAELGRPWTGATPTRSARGPELAPDRVTLSRPGSRMEALLLLRAELRESHVIATGLGNELCLGAAPPRTAAPHGPLRTHPGPASHPQERPLPGAEQAPDG